MFEWVLDKLNKAWPGCDFTEVDLDLYFNNEKNDFTPNQAHLIETLLDEYGE